MFRTSSQIMDGRWKPRTDLVPNCPRCASPNTKFCYYNNYSLSQPRYFCKGCRRYWTEGGSLRNVPVGGGCRKTRNHRSVRLPTAYPKIPAGSSQRDPAGDSSFPSNEDVNLNGSHIDLAVVFAKFLNQGSSQGDLDGGSQLFEDVPRKEELSGQDSNGLALEGLLGDHDGFWLEGPIVPNLSWQSMGHLQEFGSFLSGDDTRFNFSHNLDYDNRSRFDLSGFEMLPRP